MKYHRIIDVWSIPTELVGHLQRGQWVSAGPVERDRSNIGQYWGTSRAGVTHVAWIGNARASGDYRGYMKVRAGLVERPVSLRIGHPAYDGANALRVHKDRKAATLDLINRGVAREVAQNAIQRACSGSKPYITVRAGYLNVVEIQAN